MRWFWDLASRLVYSAILNCHKATKLANGSTVAGATTSSVAMLACCAHHVTDVLPLIGLSVFSLMLVKYQVWFLSLGILSNLAGVCLMMRQIWRMKR